MEIKEKTVQEMDAMVKKRKWKNRLGIAAMAGLVFAISAGSIVSYRKTRQDASANRMDELDFAQNKDGNFQDNASMVTAAGTTSVGVKAVTFEIDFLEDTDLYVEEVYLSDGDSVEAGDKYIKFTEESIADAREELESAALHAQLAYRSGQISDGESRLQAKYTYDMTMLDAQYAQQIYDDTIAQLDADYAQSAKTYEEAQQEYQEYLERVQNNSFYDDYDIANLKKACEEAKELYLERKEYWEVTEEELKSGSSENMGTAGMMTLSGAAGDSAVPDVEQDTLEAVPEENAGTEPPPQTDAGENAGEGTPDFKDSMASAGFGGMERQGAQSERKWIVKTVNLLEQEAEEADEKYTTALEEYEEEIASAELTLQKLLSRLETAREDFSDAEVSYQKQTLNAKTVYETAMAKGKTAQADYDTQLTSLKDSLDRLQDAKKEADSNLALFETLVGDGYLYTEESGTVLMLMAEEGRALAGGSMVFAYSNPEQISVSVSVNQNDIAKLYVGETASAVIPDHGSYSGVIETINPISTSNSRTAVQYTVTVNLQGDVSGLDSNLTATVMFGGDVSGNVSSEGGTQGYKDLSKELADTTIDREENGNGKPAGGDKKTHGTQD